jgi:hypothetical protein
VLHANAEVRTGSASCTGLQFAAAEV